MNKKRIEEILLAGFGEHEGDLGTLGRDELAELARARALRDGLASLKEESECELSTATLREAIRARMTPKERAEQDTAEKVYQGLQSLRDVPDCQLSNERLRDAILSRASKPRPAGQRWSFALGALGCVAIFVAAYSGLVRPSVADQPRETVALGTMDDSSSSVSPGQSAMRTSEPAPVEEPIEAASVPQDEPEPRAMVASVGPDHQWSLDPDNFTELVRTISFDDDDDVAVRPAAVNAAPAVPREAIVIVDPSNTTPKGAARATETSFYGDVVFGG